VGRTCWTRIKKIKIEIRAKTKIRKTTLKRKKKEDEIND
jgi:hypothetical protein